MRRLLVALDIDGTLLSYSGELSPAVADAVRAVVDAGHHVVLSTGRGVLATAPVAQLLGLDDGFMVTSNGSVTSRLDPTTPAGYEVVETVTFDPAPALAVMHAEFPTAYFAVEEVGRGFRLNREFPPGELEGAQDVVSMEQLGAHHVTRLVVRSPDHTSEEFHAAVQTLGLSDVTYAIGWTAWMDVAPDGVSKASALEKVRVELGVAAEDTIAVGDGSNDLEMLRWAARGIAMGHAPEHVRAAADEVTGTIEDDGAAHALRRVLGLR